MSLNDLIPSRWNEQNQIYVGHYRKVNWFVVALCVLTLAWCAFKVAHDRAERAKMAVSEVQP